MTISAIATHRLAVDRHSKTGEPFRSVSKISPSPPQFLFDSGLCVYPGYRLVAPDHTLYSMIISPLFSLPGHSGAPTTALKGGNELDVMRVTWMMIPVSWPVSQRTRKENLSTDWTSNRLMQSHLRFPPLGMLSSTLGPCSLVDGGPPSAI